MRTYSASFRGWEWVMLLGPLPGLAAVGAMVVVQGIPALTILTIALIAYGGLVAGVMEARSEARTAVQEEPELELLGDVPVTGAAASVSVAAVTGGCPLGFRPGFSWTVDQAGKLSTPMCRPAAIGLAQAVGASARDGSWAVFHCQCPMARGDVAFTVGAKAA